MNSTVKKRRRRIIELKRRNGKTINGMRKETKITIRRINDGKVKKGKEGEYYDEMI